MSDGDLPYTDVMGTVTVENDPPVPPAGLSLKARMQARAQANANATAEYFFVPGFESIVAVKLRRLTLTEKSRLASKNERVRPESLNLLYNACDQILGATVGFKEVVDGVMPADDEEPDPGLDWVTCAINVYPELGQGNGVTERQALIRLVGQDRIENLLNEWAKWAAATSVDDDQEIRSDFGRTG